MRACVWVGGGWGGGGGPILRGGVTSFPDLGGRSDVIGRCLGSLRLIFFRGGYVRLVEGLLVRHWGRPLKKGQVGGVGRWGWGGWWGGILHDTETVTSLSAGIQDLSSNSGLFF